MRPKTAEKRQATRLDRLPWSVIRRALDVDGIAVAPQVLSSEDCRSLIALQRKKSAFRESIDLTRFDGRGAYHYFAEPAPTIVASLKSQLYQRLLPLANAWARKLGVAKYPRDHTSFLDLCRKRGQTNETSILLRYTKGDFNAIHGDLYGDVLFPFQCAVVLSARHHGGEMVFLESREGHQARARVVAPLPGQLVIFASDKRPLPKGEFAVLRHGVSTIHQGQRWALGIVCGLTSLI